jgi:cytochrome c553
MRALLAVLAAFLSFPVLADSKAGEKKAQLCLLCHKPGPVGAPLLEAQPAKYLAAQIAAFKAGKRTDPAMRSNVANLSTRDIADIAEYFSKRPAHVGLFSPDAGKATAGEKRVSELKCAGCHQPNFHGTEAIPRLAGQVPSYLIQQMDDFNAGRRQHPPSEIGAAKGEEVENIANHLSTLK